MCQDDRGHYVMVDGERVYLEPLTNVTRIECKPDGSIILTETI